jgi:thioredoxin 1
MSYMCPCRRCCRRTTTKRRKKRPGYPILVLVRQPAEVASLPLGHSLAPSCFQRSFIVSLNQKTYIPSAVMLCCIGGVCVPYTAVVPILLLALKWLAQKLANYGLLPSAIGDLLQIKPQPKGSVDATCCSGSTMKSLPPVAPEDSVVVTLKESQELDEILSKHQLVVCKFTAVWCQPCKKIQPFVEQLAVHFTSQKKEGQVAFVIIDVDDHEDIANQYNVAMMPTFLILEKEGSVKATYRGSSEPELQSFLQSNL